ncbi:TIGR03111 family XrtG-associated glycosyltransferase [Phosphitispora fastidiosa]|uniref:TIGR03111 family XrtG-associated glycosyltransferase n=1 Tax=Phosphitispora fastidiosa TaxID=2837202 RepID=UPI001E2AB0BB|nr:TIGR03111 family XrtG-associated glycosyltransferase [Phosphitispora fastidiosa]MBU7005820.1 putative glycosyltransferase (exosortase G-associated) [Phosphitispora fastidiosa]
MNRDLLYSFIVFWGIWILIPILVDGVIALVHIVFSWRELRERKKDDANDGRLPGFYPQISVVIPVFNSESTLLECLESVACQTYPMGRVELFLIDNGSTDGSLAVFQSFSDKNPDMILRWIKLNEPGKAKALNTGIFLGSSEILINIDSDTKLGPNVLMETVKALFAQEEVAGATAAIMIDFSRISKKSLLLRLVQSCELVEYLEAFFIGRKYQAHHNNLFTLAGAFSCFNRKSLLQTFLYDQNSISEDTKLTFELRRKNQCKKIMFLENAKVYVEPIPSLKKLYSQRVRWQRGELEVIASYVDHYKGGLLKLARSYAARTLFVDHTLMFPRIVWTILTPLLIFFGYPMELIILANFFVYLVYLFIDINYLLIAYQHIDGEYQDYLKNNAWRVIFMPLYRFLVFWFRAAGAIHAVTERAIWTVEDPVNQTIKAIGKLKH